MLDHDNIAYIIDLNEVDDGDHTTISMDFTVNYGPMVMAPSNVTRPKRGGRVRVHSADEDTLYWAVVVKKLSDRDYKVRILWGTCTPVLNIDWSVASAPTFSSGAKTDAIASGI